MTYELWRNDSDNLSGAWRTEREALAALAQGIVRGDGPIIRRSVLARVERNGERTIVLEGDALYDRAANARASHPRPRRRAA